MILESKNDEHIIQGQMLQIGQTRLTIIYTNHYFLNCQMILELIQRKHFNLNDLSETMGEKIIRPVLSNQK